MNKALLSLVLIALAGCASPSGKTGLNATPGSTVMTAQAAPTYEHQLYYEYAEGATPFLRLVEVTDP